MKITDAVIFVELDNSNELRQLFIKEGSPKELLIHLIKHGAFHDEEITISEKIFDSLKMTKD